MKTRLVVIAVALMLVSVGILKADTLSTPQMPQAYYNISWLNVDGWLPLQHVDASPFIKAFNGTGVDKTSSIDAMGADTKLFVFPSKAYKVIPADFFALNFGAATSQQLNGAPYLSISCNVCQIFTKAPSFLSYVGIGYCRNFKDNASYLTIYTSVPINFNKLYTICGVLVK